MSSLGTGNILSICIPTYNRGKLAEVRLEELIPQLRPGLEILVVDNASTDDTKDRVSRFLGPQVSYHRNPCNIGGGANLSACAQQASGNWIWLLGDDDSVTTDAVENAIKEASQATENCAAIHFSWSCSDHAPQDRKIDSFNSVSSLLSEIDIGTALFISTTLYKRSLFIENAPSYMGAIFTSGPHLSIYLRGLDSGNLVGRNSKLSLLKSQSGAGTRWSTIDAVIGLSSVPVFIRSAEGKRAYAKAFWKWREWALRMAVREFSDQAIRQRWRYAYWFSLYNHMLNTSSASFLVTDWILLIKRTFWRKRFPKADFFLLIFGLFGWNWAGDKLLQITNVEQENVQYEY